MTVEQSIRELSPLFNIGGTAFWNFRTSLQIYLNIIGCVHEVICQIPITFIPLIKESGWRKKIFWEVTHH